MTARTQATHARWQEGLSRLRAYAHTHGGANPHTRLVVDGFRLGRWAAVQRERSWANRLPPEHITALQGVPGWDWGRTNADRWAEGLTHLRSYLDEHGTTAVDTRTVHEGFELGTGWPGGAATTTRAPCPPPASPCWRRCRGGCGPAPKTAGPPA